ncbi:MAG: PEP-CTERM sorting domain-containing protein [Thermoguttaceae bacterium]
MAGERGCRKTTRRPTNDRSNQMTSVSTRRFQYAVSVLSLLLLLAPAAWATDIEGVLMMAADQPQTYMIVRSSYDGAPYTAGGELGYIQAYLDTGCSGILLSQETASSLTNGGTVGLASSTNGGSTVTFQDVGVGGGFSVNVSQPLYYSVGTYSLASDPTNLSLYNQTYGPVRMQLNQTAASDFSEAIDVVGTPAMVGKVVVIDPKPSESLSDVMQATIYNPGSSAIPTTNRHVKLSLPTFDRFTQTSPAVADGPTLAHNPFIGANPVSKIDSSVPAGDAQGISIAYGGHSATGSFLLDTGAQLSMISTQLASSLHVRYTPGCEPGNTKGNDPQLETYDPANPSLPGAVLSGQFQAAVGGLGGSKTVMGFNLASLAVPTVEGDPLRYLNAPVLVADITAEDSITGKSLTLDGVFGMNFLAMSADLDTFDMHAGAYDWIVYDDAHATLGLDLRGATSVPEPAALTLLVVGLSVLGLRQLARRRAS